MNRIRLIGLTGLLLGICHFACEKTLGPITNNNTGGSEVVGTLVLKTGGPAKNAQVIANRVLLDSVVIDSVVFVKAVFADIGGNYKFDSLDTGKYILACKAVNNQDTFYASINFHLDSVASPKQPTFKDTIGIDTLYRPGSISGQVSVNYPVDLHHIYCNIPGTSYNANPDSMGAFKISGVPQGTYTVLFSSSATGFSVADTQVQRIAVRPDSNTNIGLIKLHLSDGQIIPEILGLTANYDSSTDQVSLSWDSIPIPNFDHYLVIRKDSSAVIIPSMQIDSIKTTNASFVDKISFSDTLSYSIGYSIECFDVSGFHSPLSQPVTIQAIAPEGRTVDSLKAPDSAGVSDLIAITANFINSSSPVKTITWSTSIGDSVHAINKNFGADTLKISFAYPGRQTIYFKTIDNLGRTSKDSTFVTIVKDVPKVNFITANQTVAFGASVQCSLAITHSFGTCTLSVNFGNNAPLPAKNWYKSQSIVFDTVFKTSNTGNMEKVDIKITDSHGNFIDTGFTLTIQPAITDQWVLSQAEMINHHSQHASVVLNGQLYVIGGNKLQLGAGGKSIPFATGSVEAYDTLLKTWVSKDSLCVSRSDFSAVVVNGKIYAIGGVNNHGYVSAIEQYDPLSGWTVYDTTKQFSRAGTACCAIGSKIYLFGGRTFSDGESSDSACQSILVYDIALKTWSQNLSIRLNIARSDFQAVPFKGKIYLMGGLGGDLDVDPLKSVEIFDTTTGKCTLASWELPEELNNFSAVSIDSGIYIIGGINSNLNSIVGSVSLLNPNTGVPVAKAPMSICNAAASAIGNKIYLTGGLTDLGPPANESSDRNLFIYYP